MGCVKSSNDRGLHGTKPNRSQERSQKRCQNCRPDCHQIIRAWTNSSKNWRIHPKSRTRARKEIKGISNLNLDRNWHGRHYEKMTLTLRTISKMTNAAVEIRLLVICFVSLLMSEGTFCNQKYSDC